MGISLTALSGVHAAATMRARLTTIEKFVNGGIVQADLATGVWVKPQHVYKPDLRYPSWADMPSSSVWWRYAPFARQARSFHHAHHIGTSRWQPIANAAATAVVTEDSRPFNLMVSLYTYQEEGSEYIDGTSGSGLDPSTTATPAGDEHTVAATFAIFVNGTKVTATERVVYMRGTDLQYCRKQLSWALQVSLDQGVNEVQVMVKLNAAEFYPQNTNSGDYKRVIVDCRNFVLDVQYR